MPSASQQSPGLAAVAVGRTAPTHSLAPGLAASSRLHGRVASMSTSPAALASALAPSALGLASALFGLAAATGTGYSLPLSLSLSLSSSVFSLARAVSPILKIQTTQWI